MGSRLMLPDLKARRGFFPSDKGPPGEDRQVMLLDKWERRWRRLIFIIIYHRKLQQRFAHYGQDLQTKRGGPKKAFRARASAVWKQHEPGRQQPSPSSSDSTADSD